MREAKSTYFPAQISVLIFWGTVKPSGMPAVIRVRDSPGDLFISRELSLPKISPMLMVCSVEFSEADSSPSACLGGTD